MNGLLGSKNLSNVLGVNQLNGMRKVIPNKHNKSMARLVTREAIRQGRLTKKPCGVCGKGKVVAHHTDYGKPFEVMWLFGFLGYGSCLRPFMSLYLPPQEHSRLCNVSKINSTHASSLGNCLLRLWIPYLFFIPLSYTRLVMLSRDTRLVIHSLEVENNLSIVYNIYYGK